MRSTRRVSWVREVSPRVPGIPPLNLSRSLSLALTRPVGFIFGPMAILAVFFAYFSVPECRGRSLEEVDLLFHNGITARGSVKWRPESTTAELLHAVELSTGGAPKAVEADAEEKDVAMIA